MDEMQQKFIDRDKKAQQRGNSITSYKGTSSKRLSSGFRGSSGKFNMEYFPVYMVKADSTLNDKTLELKDFYRSKGSKANIKVGTNPDILRQVDSRYYCDLFWALESQSVPYIVTRQRDEDALLQAEAEEYERKQEIIQEAQNLIQFERQTL